MARERKNKGLTSTGTSTGRGYSKGDKKRNFRGRWIKRASRKGE